jgi:hypothetical protein
LIIELNITLQRRIIDTSIQYLLKKCAILEVLDISGGQTLTKSALTDNVLISIGNYGKNLQQLTIHNNDKITFYFYTLEFPFVTIYYTLDIILFGQ